jgi:AcrR family transcriptional regulator
MDSLADKVRTATGKAQSAARRIEKFKDVFLSFVQEKKNFFQLYFVTRFEVLPYLDEDLAQRLLATTRELDAIFHDIYEQGMNSGELRPGDPMSMGDIFFSQLIGLMLLKNAEMLEPPLPSLANMGTEFFIANIKTGKGNSGNGKK